MEQLNEKYDLQGKIGVGAFSTVFVATQKATGKQFAVKHSDKKVVAPKNYLREIQIFQRLIGNGHPNIVHVEEILEDEENVFIIQEYLPQGNLLIYLSENAPLSEQQVKKIFVPIMSAVQYLHSIQVAHRDIKLENILMTKDGVPKLIDFNLSCFWEPLSFQKGFCGSQEYCSPEIFLRQPYVGPEVDVWALGVLLYAMLFCVFPFKPAATGRSGEKSKTDFALLVVKGAFSFPESHVASTMACDVIKAMLTQNLTHRPSLATVAQMPWFLSVKPPSLIDIVLNAEPHLHAKAKMEDKVTEVTNAYQPELFEGEEIHEEWVKKCYEKQKVTLTDRPNKLQERRNTTGVFSKTQSLWGKVLRVGKSLHFN